MGRDISMIFFVSPNERELLSNAGDRAPLGLGYLSSYCKEILNIKTRIFDLNHDEEKMLMIAIDIERPEYICFSVTTPLYQECLRLARTIKLIYKSKLIAGGNHITDHPSEKLTKEIFDYIIVGDGELALKKIINDDAPNQIIVSDKVDVDDVPWPDYEGLKYERYNMTFEGKKCAMMVASRGCIYGCAFCGSAKIKKWRPRDPKKVIEEMEYLIKNYDIESFYFGDDIFSFDKTRTIKLACMIQKLNVTFRITTRVDLIDEDILFTLHNSGCKVICLGLESGDDQILKNIQKGATVQKARDAVRMVHEAKMKVKGFFIIGLPGETEETANKTIEFAKELNVDYVDFYPYTPYPSTPIWDNPEKYNLEVIKPTNSDWNQYFQVNKDGMPKEWKVKHPNLTTEQVMSLIEKAHKEVNVAGMTK